MYICKADTKYVYAGKNRFNEQPYILHTIHTNRQRIQTRENVHIIYILKGLHKLPTLLQVSFKSLAILKTGVCFLLSIPMIDESD